MPLLDHFHMPLRARRHPESFHSAWATVIVQKLNGSLLPDGFSAEPHVRLGVQVEADVGTWQEDRTTSAGNGQGAGTTVWAPSRPTLTLAVDFADLDLFEVQVRNPNGSLVAIIELVSPANKDRPSHRKVFAGKCASYLREGVAVVVIDIVTDRKANLHHELMSFLDLEADSPMDRSNLYAVAYRTIVLNGQWRLEAWPEILSLGEPLPTLPLWLEEDLAVPLELELSYQATCESLRIPC